MKALETANAGEIQKICKALSAKTRLDAVRALGSGAKTVAEVLQKIGGGKRRETIYQALEMLAEADILRKFYDQEKKKIMYALRTDRVSLMLLPKAPEET